MRLNPHFSKFQEDYVYLTIQEKVEAFKQTNPQANILDLGIGDVSRPLAPGIVTAIQQAADDQLKMETFHGYGPKGGYSFLIEKILTNDYLDKGIHLNEKEIFISDGSKSDGAHIQDLFDDNVKIAVVDPFYPVYIDSNVMAGRAGEYDCKTRRWSQLIYLDANESNDFIPDIPNEVVDVIYLNYPNNPTGKAINKDDLQRFVNYANENNALIVFDAAYEAFIQTDAMPHSIYECDGANKCAIELKSFSKSAGFTGLRLGYMVIPEELAYDGQSLNQLWARREATKFNGASYIIQKAGAAVYEAATQKNLRENIQHYLTNAKRVKGALEGLGMQVYGGEDAPYLWLKSPKEQSSWEFFDDLFNKYQIISTPGSAYGANGEQFVRLSMFASDTVITELLQRLTK